MELLADLGVDGGENMIEEFDNRHLSAEPAPHRAEFEPDDASADDEELFRHGGEIKRARRGDGALFCNLRAGLPRSIRTVGGSDRPCSPACPCSQLPTV